MARALCAAQSGRAEWRRPGGIAASSCNGEWIRTRTRLIDCLRIRKHAIQLVIMLRLPQAALPPGLAIVPVRECDLEESALSFLVGGVIDALLNGDVPSGRLLLVGLVVFADGTIVDAIPRFLNVLEVPTPDLLIAVIV